MVAGVPLEGDLDLDEGTGQRDAGLGLARASVLAGIVPAPSAYNPVRDMALAKVRQRYTLNRMVIGGLITPDQASDAFARDITPLQETPPEWLTELRRTGPHPRPVVAQKLGITITALKRNDLDQPLTTAEIKALLAATASVPG